MFRWYFPNKDLAWRYAWVIGESQNWTVVDYGVDENGYYIDFKKEV